MPFRSAVSEARRTPSPPKSNMPAVVTWLCKVPGLGSRGLNGIHEGKLKLLLDVIG